jgi:hypothetical protein
MKRIRIVGLCLVAAFALSAIVASSALAAKHVNTGPIKYKSASGIAFLELEGAGKVECKTSTAVGEITTATSGTVTATFVGCETLGKKCTSKAAAEGTIITKLLATSTGYVNKPKAEVGTDFKPAAGIYLAEFECPGSPDIFNKVKGSVIGRLAPANEMSVKSKSDLKNSGGKQEVEKFEGGEKDTLISEVSSTGEGGPFSSLPGIQNVDSEVENQPQEVKKGKKTEKFADPAEVKTGGTSPEYGRCRAKPKGKFLDGNCQNKITGKQKGKFEFFPVPS